MTYQLLLKRMLVTVTLIAASILITLFTSFGRNELTLHFLMYIPYVVEGELWRLITPIFIHFNLIHIVFNLLWLLDLGQAIETRRGSLHLIVLVIVTAIAGNLGEYLWSGPVRFGGMSGVVYGLLGYIWIQGIFNPWAGIGLRKPILIMMLIWFVVCWLGFIGNIANMAHTMGLVSGIILGFIFSIGSLAKPQR